MAFFALFLTVTVLLFSVISVSVFRRVIGLDRGTDKKKEQFLERKKKMKAPETSHLHIKKNSGKTDDSDKKTDGGIMTFLIVLTAGFGMFLDMD